MLHRLKTFLQDSGIAAETAAAPNFRTKRIGHDAELLSRQIREHHSRDKLTLFGYSMGGLIAIMALKNPAAAARVRRVITFGTPFDGTWAAWPGIILGAGWTMNPAELRPGSSLLAEARSMLADEDRPWSFTAVNGQRDFLAPSPQRSVPAHEAVHGPFGHMSILRDADLHRLIARLISAP